MKSTTILSFKFTLLIVLGVIVTFLSHSEWVSAQIPLNELVIGSPSVIETMDPAQHMSSGSKKGENLVYNNLVAYERESSKIVPELAESWTITPDGKEIVFKLRKGVKFHDGTPFNAEAVKFNWDRMLKADLSAAGKYKTYADLNSVEVIDDSYSPVQTDHSHTQCHGLFCRRAQILYQQSNLHQSPYHCRRPPGPQVDEYP